jgi:hypothetical protein
MNVAKLVKQAAKEILEALTGGGVPLAVDAYIGHECRTDYSLFGDAIRAELEGKVPAHILDRIFYPGAGERDNAKQVYEFYERVRHENP